jgi:predicted nucleic acid-binding protein
MRPYADTNFFTRYYLETAEPGTAAALIERAEREGARELPVTWLHRVELCNALQLHVFQGSMPGQKRVTPEQASAALATFRDNLERRELVRPVPLAIDELERQSENLSLRHTAKHGFRTYDLLHVSSALLLGCDTFWSFDPKATRLAELEGLHVLPARGS